MTAIGSIISSASSGRTRAPSARWPVVSTPADEADQIAQGERILALFTNTPSQITAEDLGLIPDFVREVARDGGPARLQGDSLGTRLAHARPALRAAPDASRPSPWPPPARTTSSRSRSGGTWRPPTRSASSSARCGENIVPRGVDPATVPFNAGLHKLMLESAYGAGSDLLLVADAGRLRLARPDQRAGDRRRRRTGRGGSRSRSSSSRTTRR